MSAAPVSFHLALAGLLRSTRKARGWTQSDVAKRAGVSTCAVSMAERNLRGVSAAARERIMRALTDAPHA